MRLPGIARLGIFALCVGVLVHASVRYWVNSRTLLPLDIPVSLAPGQIRTGNLKINIEAFFSIQIRSSFNTDASCSYQDVLQTRQLRFLGSQAISAEGARQSMGSDVTQGTYLGSFYGKPGNYSLDIEVLSATRDFDRCRPRLQIDASAYDYNQWGTTLDDSFLFFVFCEGIGGALLLAFVSTRSRAKSLEQLRLRIFAADRPSSPPPPTVPESARSFPLLLVLGAAGVVAGIAVFAATGHWYDTRDIAVPGFDRFADEDLNAELQLVSLLSVSAGLGSLLASDFVRRWRRDCALPLTPAVPGQKPLWGITGLSYRRFPVRRGWAVNPVMNIPAIGLALSLAFVGLVPVWIVYAGNQTNSRGLSASLPRKGVSAAAGLEGLTAPLMQIDAKRRIYLNYKETSWEQLPAGLEQSLRGLPVRVAYFEGDRDILFMDAARAIDIIEGTGAKALLLTPNSKAAN